MCEMLIMVVVVSGKRLEKCRKGLGQSLRKLVVN